MPTPNALAEATVSRFRADLEALTGPIEQGVRIGIMVSGGGDSLALLVLAHGAIPGRIAAATVDHGLRPEAAAEAAMVGRICASLGIDHQCLRARNSERQAGNISEKSRIFRYRLIAEWAERETISIIASAHQRDDVAESFLMRALRGSGVGGLARMAAAGPLPYSEASGRTRLVRPLLGWSRAELTAICIEAGLDPVRDPSNEDERYDRARIRKLLAREAVLDPAMLARASANLAEGEEAILWMTGWAWRSRARIGDLEIVLDLVDLPREIQRRLVHKAISMLAPHWRGEGLDRLLTILSGGKPATLVGVSVVPGTMWHFRTAPPRSSGR